MPEVDLSSLSGPELRRLLDSSRQRGQAALSYRILQEMEARRAQADRRSRRGAVGGPRVVDVQLGDPLEADEAEPALRLAEPDPIEPADPDAPAPDDDALRLEPRAEPPPRPRKPRKPPRPPKPAKAPRAAPPPGERRRWPIGVFTAGVVLGGALGFGVARDALSLDGPAAAVFPSAPLLRPDQIPAASPPPAPPAAPAPDAGAANPVDAVPAPPADAAPATTAVAPPAQPQPAPTPQVAPAPAAPAPPPQAAEAAAPETAEAKACAHAATPADRVICGDPQLQKLQQKLRRAYADALAAHEDRATLREHQLAWAEARKGVTDPDRLAQLYEERIRKLNAATEAAREGR